MYIYSVYINTHTCMHIFKKNVSFILNIFIYNINYVNININVNIFKIYSLHNKYTQYTHILCKQKNAVNHD